MDRDEKGVCFMRSESLSQLQGSDQIDSSIYDLVFAGDVPCSNLEDIYRMFNVNHPNGYTGRSLSVSDVVQIQDSSTNGPTFHYCDSFGFKQVQFEHFIKKIKHLKFVEKLIEYASYLEVPGIKFLTTSILSIPLYM